jgi:hypothetical protein
MGDKYFKTDIVLNNGFILTLVSCVSV